MSAVCCLQVQQALQRSHWPAELYGSACPKSGGERYAASASIISELGPATAEVVLKLPGPLRRSGSHSNEVASAVAAGRQAEPEHDLVACGTPPSSATNLVDMGNQAAHNSSLVAGLVHRLRGRGHHKRNLSKESVSPCSASITLAQTGNWKGSAAGQPSRQLQAHCHQGVQV